MIVIVDYGVGNLASVKNMFRRIGVQDVAISGDPEVILRADKLLLPGVGSFDAGVESLNSSGLIPHLNKKVLVDKIPVLGICLGMQLMSRRSEEGKLGGLAWIDADTVKFELSADTNLKVPHMGWDYIKVQKQNALLPMDEKQRYYFVHSYHVKCDTAEQVLATCEFGNLFTCAINKGNIFGTQFHPEKSLKFGMKVLSNFSKL